MRPIYRLLAVLAALAAPCPVIAQEDPASLGHYWQAPAYSTEMRLQLLVMVALLCLGAIWVRIAAKRKRARR